jgi:cobalt-zinc-cadmium efflux system protein
MEAAQKRDKNPHVDVDTAIKGRLKLSIGLTGIIFIAELVGGVLTNSLALMSDAVHVLMDLLALSLSWFAIYVSGLPPTEKRTFGLHRVEVLVSFINSVSLLFVTLFIFYKAYGRLLAPEPVESVGMLVVAAIGLFVNLAVAMWLRHYARTDLNVKSAFLHVVGDAAASVGVIAGSVIIYYTGWYVVDPLISVMIGGIILFGVFKILAESSHILLEGVPKEISLNAVVDDMKSASGVKNVHSLHIWSICHNVYALSAHLDIAPSERWRIGEIFSEPERYHIFYTTLQAECMGCNPDEIFRRVAHKEHNHIH